MHREQKRCQGERTEPGAWRAQLSPAPVSRDLEQHQLGRAIWHRRAFDFPADLPVLQNQAQQRVLLAEIEFRWLPRASTSGVCPAAASAVNSGQWEEEVGTVEESTQHRREVTAPGPGEEPPVLRQVLSWLNFCELTGLGRERKKTKKNTHSP